MHLNLPKPDLSLIKTISAMTTHELDNPVFVMNQEKHIKSSGLNVAKCVYRTHNLLIKYVMQVYQPFFEEKVQPVLINLINTDTTMAFYPPHVDQKRLTSLNFYIESGGDNVTTTVYKEEGNFDLLGSSKNYNEVTVDNTYQFNDQAWYLLDVNRYHSVENIMTNRSIFCLSFADLTTNSFKQKYKHLFI